MGGGWEVDRLVISVVEGHQGNTESAFAKLEGLVMMGIPYKRFEALLVLTVRS
jgi:hypothetical protein